MYSNTDARASARVRNRASWTRSVLSAAKKLSMGALSRQLPRRLIDCWIPSRSSTARYGPAAYCPGSSGRRNSCVRRSQQLVKGLGRCSPAQGFAWPAIEGRSHGCKVLGAVHAEVGALWKVLPQQPVGVLARAALPRAVGIAEVDRHASLDPELGVLGHLRSPIPRQRPSELLG